MFTASELILLGFDRVSNDGAIYYQYITNPNDYFNSKYMVTSDLPKGEDESTYKFEVENTILGNSERSFLLRNEVHSIIEVSKIKYK